MTEQVVGAFLAVACVWMTLIGRKTKPTRKTNALDTFATSVDKVVTKRIVSWLPQIARKR